MTGERSAFDETLERMYNRASLDALPAHLEETYGISVSGVTPLDVGVLRVDRRDGDPWVARVFSALRPPAETEGDAEVLRHLAQHDFPAERLAHPRPISSLEGQQVLVTAFLATTKRKLEPDAQELIGRLQAQLHGLPLPSGAAARAAGALHHFSSGTRGDELAMAGRWLDQIEGRVPASARPHLGALRAALDEADDGHGLPQALVHPDPVPKNMVRVESGYAYVDWTGAGIAPRAVALGWILGPRVMAGYSESAVLSEEEWERLPGIIVGRGLVDLCFRLCFTPDKVEAMAKRLSTIRRNARAKVALARASVA